MGSLRPPKLEQNKRKTEKRRKVENLAQQRTHKFKVIWHCRKVERAKMSLTYLINNFFSARRLQLFLLLPASFLSMPIMQFLMHLTFMTATFHYDYMRRHKIPFCPTKKRRESSHILLAPINLLKTSDEKVGK